MSLTAAPAKPLTVADANRPGMPAGVVARLDLGVPVGDAIPGARDLVEKFTKLIDADGKPKTDEEKKAVRTVLSDLSGLIQGRQATVRVEGPLPAAAGDPERIVQLLTNLVSNGLKYNANELPEVVIGSTGAREDGFLTFFVWLAYRENSLAARLLWLIAILLLGNIAMASYVLLIVWRLPPEAPASRVLLRPTARGA